MSRPGRVAPKNRFIKNPSFEECWDDVEKEMYMAAAREKLIEEQANSTRRIIPWKWDAVGRLKEFIGGPEEENPAATDVIAIGANSNSNGVNKSKATYKILFDVKHFAPEDLEITLTDRTVIVKGKHEEMDNHNEEIIRRFTRKYILPLDTVMSHIECHLSADEVLHISAPRDAEYKEHGLILKDVKGNIVKDSFSEYAALALNSRTEIMEKERCLLRRRSCTDKYYDKYANEDQRPSILTITDYDMVPYWEREVFVSESQFGDKSDKDNFRVVVDVRPFHQYKELVVHRTHDFVLIEGKQKEKEDKHGFITRDFTRKFILPRGVNAEDIRCYLSSDGAFEITAPKSKQFMTLEDRPIRVEIMMKEEESSAESVEKGIENVEISNNIAGDGQGNRIKIRG